MVFLLPNQLALPVLSKIALPILLIYPLATWLLSRLLSRRFELERDEQIRLQDDFYSAANSTSVTLGLPLLASIKSGSR